MKKNIWLFGYTVRMTAVFVAAIFLDIWTLDRMGLFEGFVLTMRFVVIASVLTVTFLGIAHIIINVMNRACEHLTGVKILDELLH